jgi:hypothetical protein
MTSTLGDGQSRFDAKNHICPTVAAPVAAENTAVVVYAPDGDRPTSVWVVGRRAAAEASDARQAHHSPPR